MLEPDLMVFREERVKATKWNVKIVSQGIGKEWGRGGGDGRHVKVIPVVPYFQESAMKDGCRFEVISDGLSLEVWKKVKYKKAGSWRMSDS